MDALDLTALPCGDLATTLHGRRLRAAFTVADATRAADIAEAYAHNAHIDRVRADMVTAYAAAYAAGDWRRQEELLADAAFLDAANPDVLPLTDELHALRYGQAA